MASKGIITFYEHDIPDFRNKDKQHRPDFALNINCQTKYYDVMITKARIPCANGLTQALNLKMAQYRNGSKDISQNLIPLIFDDDCRIEEKTQMALMKLEIPKTIIRAIQYTIIKSNMKCFNNVMKFYAEMKEQTNISSGSLLETKYSQLDDMLAL